MVDGRRLVFDTAFRELRAEDFRGSFTSLFGEWAPGFLTEMTKGTLTGSLRFELNGEQGAWSGSFRATPEVKLPGVLAPITAESLTVELAAGRMTVPQFHGQVGAVAFDASYRYEPGVEIPHLFSLTVPVLDLAEVERLLAPTFNRQGAVARTLGFPNASAPEWLLRRRAEGTIRATSLIWHGKTYPNARARVRWQGVIVEIDNIELASGRGSVKIDLSGGSPVYETTGNLSPED